MSDLISREEAIAACEPPPLTHYGPEPFRICQAFIRALPAAPAVKVKPLVWDNIGRGVGWSDDREDTHLHTATALGRFYEVALGKDGWWAKWRGDYRARGLPTPEAAKAAAQADYEDRILGELEGIAE